MTSSIFIVLNCFAVNILLFVIYAIYQVFLAPRYNPLRELDGPPLNSFWGSHMTFVLDPFKSRKYHHKYVAEHGRSFRLRGIGPWDERLFTLDPVSMVHVLKHSNIYEKPWQSRRLISNLVGTGLLAAEGAVHKRQRTVATPAFSISNMRALVPLVYRKGDELKDRWTELIKENGGGPTRLDVCHWISRATFDVIGLAGFGYSFSAIQDESNELFQAYKEMFEIAVSQDKRGSVTALCIYFPFLESILRRKVSQTVRKCHEVIFRIAGELVQERKRRLVEAEKTGSTHIGKDLLTLLLKANMATDLPPDQRISDADIFDNINTFMFAGSDTTSLALTWALYLLAKHSQIQNHLRDELLSLGHATPESELTTEEIESLHHSIEGLPFLNNVCREVLRLIPPLHSSLRVATADDIVPTSYPVRVREPNGNVKERMQGVRIQKGTFVHVPIEGFHLDKEFWGEDAWQFNPDRWDHLPEAAMNLPGLLPTLLTFSAGPRSCIGMKFSMIELKTWLSLLVTNFVFEETEEKIIRANVVLTRPYVAGKFKQGSQCPLLVRPYVR